VLQSKQVTGTVPLTAGAVS